jgi:YVTN family beta-propeller protein
VGLIYNEANVTLSAMSEMPTGAVTFLFTDIEGSTRLVKQLRESYGNVLHEHQRLLRAAFEAHGGYEVDTQGDSFFVAFASARDALLAAVEGQLALGSHAWPDGVDIKVRMGLHTGQAVAAAGRYTGLAVHRAARIGAAAHGGQILVSQATQTLLEDEEEDLYIFLRDLGEQRLKDLDRPVRLYQAGADGLPASFPPLRSSAEPAHAAESAPQPVSFWRRPLVLAAGAVLLLGVLAAVVLATRHSDSGLSGIQPDHVGVIDPKTSHIVAEVPVGIQPGAIAAGAGSVWVGNVQDRSLTRIDPAQRSVVGTISLGSRTPTGIAVGAGGVWVAHGLRGDVARVDPQFGEVTETIAVGGTAFGSPKGSVAVDSQSLWAVFGDSTLARIDTADNRVAGKGLAGTQPSGVVVGRGAVWVVNEGDATVLGFNPQTFEEGPVRTPISVGKRPSAIAFGESALWVPNAADGTVTKIDPVSGSTSTIGVGDGPTAIAVGSGAVWVANTGDGTISRIDPGTNEVTRTIDVGNAPSGLAVSDGFLWVTVQAP